MCVVLCYLFLLFCFFKQKTAYEMRISDWSSDVCSSDLEVFFERRRPDGFVDNSQASLHEFPTTPQAQQHQPQISFFRNEKRLWLPNAHLARLPGDRKSVV